MLGSVQAQGDVTSGSIRNGETALVGRYTACKSLGGLHYRMLLLFFAAPSARLSPHSPARNYVMTGLLTMGGGKRKEKIK